MRNNLQVYLDPEDPACYVGIGTTIFSLTGTNNFFTAGGGASVSNVFTKASSIPYLNMVNATSKIISSYTPTLVNNPSYTFDLWFWDNAPDPGAGQVLFHTFGPSSSFSSFVGPNLGVAPEGYFSFDEYNNTSVSVNLSTPIASNVCNSTWHHVSVVGIGTTQTMYLDGRRVATAGRVGGTLTNASLCFYDGVIGSGPYRIGPFRFYNNYAFTPSDVQRHYNKEKGRFRPIQQGLALALDPHDYNCYIGSGTTLNDLSGFGRNCTLQSATVVGTTAGNSNYFNINGNNSYINTTYSPSFNNNTNYTYELWFWDNAFGTTTTGSAVNNTALISNCRTVTSQFAILHVSGTDGKAFFWEKNTAAAETIIYTRSNICDGSWHHLAAVAEGTTMKLYVDGFLGSSGTRPGGNITSGEALVIGGGHLSNWQTCRIGACRVYYDKALTADEIAWNYALERPRYGSMEIGLSLTTSYAPLASGHVPTATQRGQNAVFACEVIIPVSPSGLIYEFGGTGNSTYLGFRNSTTLRFRAGGSESTNVSTTGCALLDITDFPNDGLVHTIVADVRVASGRVRVWIDNIFKGEAYTVGTGAILSSLWAGTGGGGYGLVSTDTALGEVTTNFNGTLVSNLRFYANQLVRYF